MEIPEAIYRNKCAQVAALVVTQVVVCGETIVAVVHYVSENADTAGGGCRVSLGSA